MKSLQTKITTLVASAALLPATAFAQAAGNFGAQGFGSAVCGFLQSPIISVLFAVILIALILAWLNDLVKGIALEIIKILIGAFAILNINTVLRWIGMHPFC